MDGGNLAPSLQRRCLSAPYPLFNIGTESPRKQVCANDGNLAPPQTGQLSMLKKRGCGDAPSRHTRCLLCGWCKISSIHRLDVLGENIQAMCARVIHVDRTTNTSGEICLLPEGSVTVGLKAGQGAEALPLPLRGPHLLQSARAVCVA